MYNKIKVQKKILKVSKIIINVTEFKHGYNIYKIDFQRSCTVTCF